MEQRFELDIFAGPLDLLLYLVQKEEVDIREVSLVRICDQYLEILEEVKKTNIELAGDFFVMAATLMGIKARALLPHEAIDLDEELDPEEELIGQLLEYRRVKEASRFLSKRAEARSLVHPSRPQVSDAGIPMDEVDLLDLVTAFRAVLNETGLDRGTQGVIASDRPVSAYVGDLLSRLRQHRKMSFFEVFAGSTTRYDLIGNFLALLELMKAGLVAARQDIQFGEIDIEAIGEIPASLTSLGEPLTSDRLEGEAHEPEPSDDSVSEEQELLENPQEQ